MEKDLKYRFDEIITTIALTPTDPTDDDRENGLLLPNLTRDLHEPELFTAILCQTFKSHSADEDDEFAQKMCSLLVNSALQSVQDNDELSADDTHALALAVNIAWALGSGEFMFRAIGLLGAVCDRFDKEIPSISFAIFKANKGADKFGRLDPYRILRGDYDPFDMIKETHPEMGEELSAEDIDRIKAVLSAMLEDKE